MSSSYQDFIVNTLRNTASDSDVQEAIDNFIVFDNDNNLLSGKIKDLFESMGLTEEGPNGTVIVTGKNSLDSIQTRLTNIQKSITDLTTRVSALESPVITLLGDASITIDKGSTYTEQEDAGATATDTLDGDLTSSIVVGGFDTIDTNVAGDYTITYNVTDSAGNAATPVTRIVSVLGNFTLQMTLPDDHKVRHHIQDSIQGLYEANLTQAEVESLGITDYISGDARIEFVNPNGCKIRKNENFDGHWWSLTHPEYNRILQINLESDVLTSPNWQYYINPSAHTGVHMEKVSDTAIMVPV